MAGDLLKRVNLNANSVKHQQLIPLGTFAQKKSGTAKIVVVSEDKLVEIDGLGISNV